MNWMYSIGMVFTLFTLGFQVKAAREIDRCSKTLPAIWMSFAAGAFLFALDKWGDWLYFTYFMINFIVMTIAAGIVWQKTK